LKKLLIILSVLFVFAFLFLGSVSAATLETNQLNKSKTTNVGTTVDQNYTAKEGTRIVWQKMEANGKYAIYVKNLATGHSGKVQTSTQNQINSDISGTRVIWMQEYSTGKYAIYVKNIATGHCGKVKTSIYNQFNPSITGTLVVWSQIDSLNQLTICQKDLNPPRVIRTNPINNAVNIPTTKLMIITFNRLIKYPSNSLIQLKSSHGTIIPITFSIKNNALFIDHPPLQKFTSYTLTLQPNVIKDQTGVGLESSYTTKFKTGNSNLFFKARLVIPKLGIKPIIRLDTLNAYNAVFHFSNSVYPGTPGECALIGHRTTYSAILRYINLLRYNDLVYIYDYTARKKITYSVVSNGDIRWHVNPYIDINYKKSGESILTIMSCYPVGYGTNKWLAHCKLVSTVAL
jgi:sortase A